MKAATSSWAEFRSSWGSASGVEDVGPQGRSGVFAPEHAPILQKWHDGTREVVEPPGEVGSGQDETVSCSRFEEVRQLVRTSCGEPTISGVRSLRANNSAVSAMVRFRDSIRRANRREGPLPRLRTSAIGVDGSNCDKSSPAEWETHSIAASGWIKDRRYSCRSFAMLVVSPTIGCTAATRRTESGSRPASSA